MSTLIKDLSQIAEYDQISIVLEMIDQDLKSDFNIVLLNYNRIYGLTIFIL